MNNHCPGAEQVADRALRQRQRRFAADAAHELRTPLAGLRVQLEEAKLHPGQTDLRELVDSALRNVDRLQAIITDLLLLARVSAGGSAGWKSLDLAELVRKEVGRRSDRVPVRVRLEDGIVVDAVEGQLARLVANLLDNAQRHASSTVEVEVGRRGGEAELCFSDDGVGVPERDREQIFEQFARLDEVRSRDQGAPAWAWP
jgi:signal transduction histidine kinase